MTGGKGIKSKARGSSKKAHRARGSHGHRGHIVRNQGWTGDEKPDSVIEDDEIDEDETDKGTNLRV